MDLPQFATSPQKPGGAAASDTPSSSLHKDFGVCGTISQFGPTSFSTAFAMGMARGFGNHRVDLKDSAVMAVEYVTLCHIFLCWTTHSN